ncbi:MAG: SDR family oxidoreductase [Cellulomonadaceae bacterium]|nr:SDR family oxidoreductase [Cellulomonadaceae bacterium]
MTRGTPLAGATVVITGGGRGIGRLTALGAAERGARVVVWDLDAERAEAVRAEVVAEGGTAWAYAVDVSDRHAVAAAGEATLDATGGVDVVVNNAGIVTGRTLLDSDPDGIERVYGVNVLALYWVTRAFLPAMVEQGAGCVVTVSSAAGLVGVARQTDYSASKFAAFGFAESLRAEMRQQRTGVASMVVCPYYVDTGMFEGVRTRFPLLLPILREADVARALLDGVERGRAQVLLPPLVRAVPLLRVLPVSLFDRVADLLGINVTMDHFVGRAGRV